MPNVATFDGTTRRFTLNVTGDVDVRDIYSSWLRWAHNNHWAKPAFSVSGYESINPALGIVSTLYCSLVNDWRGIAIGNTNVIGGILMVEGGADEPFVAQTNQALIKYSQPIRTETVNLGSSGGSTATPSQIASAVWASATATALIAKVEAIYQIEVGDWEIVGNQMIFKGTDHTTEIARFDLKDLAGSPSMAQVFKRVKV
jgi:hypothetical protein